MKLDNINILYA